MTDTQARWIDPNPPDPMDPRTTVVLTVSGVALTIMVLAALVGVVLISTDRDGSPTGGEAALIAANTAPDHPFTQSVLVAPVVISGQAASKASMLLQQVQIKADRGVRPVSGQQPELYGATGDTFPCDVPTLANHLDADAVTARAWGLALGLSVQQIPYYLNTLTPVVLMGDTWVTAHMLADGSAQPIQVVLQAGTAVLIDPVGVPRVQCVSGAPLTPPSTGNLTQFRMTGEPWTDFAPQHVLAVNYATAGAPRSRGEFTLVDVSTGEQLARKAGGTIELGSTAVPLPDPAVMNVPPDPAVRTSAP